MISSKILTLEKLGLITAKYRKEGKRIVHCHGVFDLIHIGHIKHFVAARKFGDILVVTITEDKNVFKGPGRPVFNEILRAENIAALQIVDYVAINRSKLATTAIDAIKPDFYVKGQEYKKDADDVTGGITIERDAVEKHGGRLAFTEEITFSSSHLINRHMDDKNTELKDYLNHTREITGFEKLRKHFEEISKLNVLIIGDIILDEYQFVNPLGKASKSFAITARRLNSELYAGGVLAVANHVSNFVESVKLISVYGLNEGKSYLPFIKEKLNSNIDFDGVYEPLIPTVLKKRYVDRVFKQKLFEIVEMDDSPLPEETKGKIISKLANHSQKFDIVIVADFGHGLIDKDVVSEIERMETFTAINTQTNSSNHGYNLITKYRKCNYFSIDREEALLAFKNKHADIEEVISYILKKVNAQIGAITLGIEGCLITSSKDKRHNRAPVLSNQVVDTIGAGDAFLSVTSLMAKVGCSNEEMAFIGNAVGAMAVQILGNKSYIEKVPLLKYVKTLLT